MGGQRQAVLLSHYLQVHPSQFSCWMEDVFGSLRLLGVEVKNSSCPQLLSPQSLVKIDKDRQLVVLEEEFQVGRTSLPSLFLLAMGVHG